METTWVNPLRKPAEQLCEAARRLQAHRDDQRDASVPAMGMEKSKRIDLGLALLSMHALPGVQYSRDEIAYWCGCLPGSILNIEQKALRKLRNRLRFIKDPVLVDLMIGLFEDRKPARRKEQEP